MKKQLFSDFTRMHLTIHIKANRKIKKKHSKIICATCYPSKHQKYTIFHRRLAPKVNVLVNISNIISNLIPGCRVASTISWTIAAALSSVNKLYYHLFSKL